MSGIAFKGGAESAKATSVATINVTYTATAGNIVWVFVGVATSTLVSGLGVVDGNSTPVALTQLTSPINNGASIGAFYYTVPSTGNGGSFVANWTSPTTTCSTTVLEYSVTGGTMSVSTTNISTNTGSSSDPTISLTIDAANAFVVAGFVSGGTTQSSWTTGNLREDTTAGTARVSSGDNTSASSGTSVTCKAATSVVAWEGIAGELKFTPSGGLEPTTLMMMGI